MPEQPSRGIDVPTDALPVLSPPSLVIDAPAGGASRGNSPDDAAQSRRLRALAAEIESLPTTSAAFTRLLIVAIDALQATGAWIGLTMEDSDALVVVAAHGEVPVEQGLRVPRDHAFAARALRANSPIFSDPSTGVRWSDTQLGRVPVRAVAAPLMVDGEHAAGVISIIGGPARLFTVADGTFAHELGALAAGVLRRRDRRAPVAIAAAAPDEDRGLTTSLLLAAAAASTVEEFAAAIIHRLDDPAFLGVAVAVFDSNDGTLRFPAALGALTALRGIQTPLDPSRVEHLARQRRGVPLPDARHLVPEGWRSLVPALPGTSIALIDRDTAVGRVDIVYDAERAIPQAATRRLEQQAGMIARALSEIVGRVARAPTDHALQSLLTLRRALAVQLHDLTSPIAGIRALSELLIDEPLAPDLRDLVALIQRSAQRALEVTGTLRTLADGDDSHPDPISIAALLTAVLQERAETQRALAITVGSTIDSGMPPIAWPAIAFREWVTSALIASETALVGAARRRIDVRAGLDGAMAMITIADDGVPVGLLPSASEVHGATMSVIRTDDGRTIRRLAIPLTIGTPHHLS